MNFFATAVNIHLVLFLHELGRKRNSNLLFYHRGLGVWNEKHTNDLLYLMLIFIVYIYTMNLPLSRLQFILIITLLNDVR